jgi:hypothetical protein
LINIGMLNNNPEKIKTAIGKLKTETRKREVLFT